MKSYFKFLSRNKLYTAIEAVGLIISLALIIVIAISVRDQLSIAHGPKESGDLFFMGPNDQPWMEYQDRKFLESFPDILKTGAFIFTQQSLAGEFDQPQSFICFADKELLEMIPIPILAGDNGFLDGAGIAITASAARKFFPGRDPIGENVDFFSPNDEDDGKESAVITAIVEDPTHTILHDFDFLASFKSSFALARKATESNITENAFGVAVFMFAQIKPEADLDFITKEFIGGKKFGFQNVKSIATPYKELYFSTIDMPALKQGKYLYIWVLTLMGVLLLASALLNYINLCSAISGNRAKEMATRRLVGSYKRDIFIRTLYESMLFTLACFILAVILAFAIIPYLNSLRPASFVMPFRITFNPFFWIMGVIIILTVGGLAGLVPATLLASYRPIDVVSGRIRRRRKMVFNKICIIVQATLALVLICLTITMNSQLTYLRKLDIGADVDKDLFYYSPQAHISIRPLGDLMAQSPQVETVCYAFGIPTHMITIVSGQRLDPDGKQSLLPLSVMECDTTAFRLMGFRILETYESLRPGTVWIPEELKIFAGIDAEHNDLDRLFSYNQTYIDAIGGVVENFRRLPVNGKDPFKNIGANVFPAIKIIPDGQNAGLVLKTTGSHKEFHKTFIEIASKYFREAGGIPEFSNTEYVQCGYIDEIIAADYNDLRCFVRLMSFFSFIAVFLAIMGLLAISTWFGSDRAKDIAIRKVFGSTVNTETWRSVMSFVGYVMISALIAIPVSAVLMRRFLESYPERISCYGWIYVAATLIVLVIAFISVLWQTLRAARTNPAEELKKE